MDQIGFRLKSFIWGIFGEIFNSIGGQVYELL